MPITISSSKFSFVRFGEASAYVLPALQFFDSAFQFIVDGLLPTYNTLRLAVLDATYQPVNVFLSDIFAIPVSYRVKVPPEIYNPSSFYLFYIDISGTRVVYNRQIDYTDFVDLMLQDYGYDILFNNIFETNNPDEITVAYGANNTSEAEETTFPVFWGAGYVKATNDFISPYFLPGECFVYALKNEANEIVGISNTHKVRSDNLYSTLLTYGNDENAFEFTYDGVNPNIVRLPFYLSRPQWPTKKKVYVKSNGVHKLLSAFIEETYELRTEHLPTAMHRYLVIALAHDKVNMDCATVDTGAVDVINSDAYTPQWDADLELSLAQSKCTVTVATFGYRNDNCDTAETKCTPPILTVLSTGNSSAELSLQPPANAENILINYRDLSSLTPFWKTVEIASTRLYSLTLLNPGTSYDIRVASKCGGDYGSFGRTKRFSTTGAAACTPANSLTLVNRAGSVFTFSAAIVLPAPPEWELRIIKPDGFEESEINSFGGLVGSPFGFSWTETGALQNGPYTFAFRMRCSGTSFSAYTADVVYNVTPSGYVAPISFDFSVFSGASGNFSVTRNGVSVVNTGATQNGNTTANENDTITVSALRTGGNHLYVTVRETTSNVFIYTTPLGGLNYSRSFTFAALNGKKYEIIGSITQ